MHPWVEVRSWSYSIHVNSINKTLCPQKSVFIVILCYKNLWILGLFRWLVIRWSLGGQTAHRHLEA